MDKEYYTIKEWEAHMDDAMRREEARQEDKKNDQIVDGLLLQIIDQPKPKNTVGRLAGIIGATEILGNTDRVAVWHAVLHLYRRKYLNWYVVLTK